MRTNKRPRTSSKGPPKKKAKTSIYSKYATPSIKGPTVKRMDVALANQNYAATGTSAGAVALCLGIAQGDGENQRDGIHIRLKDITFRGEIFAAPAGSGYVDSDVLRTMLVYDRSPNGVLPNFTEIVYNNGTAGSSSIDPPSFRNRDRFLILRDWLHSTNDFTATVAAGVPTYTSHGPLENATPMVFKAYKNFKFQLDTKYLGNSAAIGSIQAGAIYVVTQGTFASPGPFYLNWSTSIGYSDNLH